MVRLFHPLSPPLLVVSVAVTAVGVAVNDGFTVSLRTAPALLLIGAGITGVATAAADRTADRLRLSVKRWWATAFVAFLPYALVTSPSSEAAAAVGDALAGSVAGVALEPVAGALALCAIAITVLYGFACYGIHPGRPTPEERVLNDGRRE